MSRWWNARVAWLGKRVEGVSTAICGTREHPWIVISDFSLAGVEKSCLISKTPFQFRMARVWSLSQHALIRWVEMKRTGLVTESKSKCQIRVLSFMMQTVLLFHSCASIFYCYLIPGFLYQQLLGKVSWASTQRSYRCFQSVIVVHLQQCLECIGRVLNTGLHVKILYVQYASIDVE